MKLGSTLSAQISSFHSQSAAHTIVLASGSETRLHPKGKGVLMMPALEPKDLVGMARGVEFGEHRDRNDRF